MASQASGPNGTDSALSAADLQRKHEAEEAHRASIEEVVDEYDLEHPSPSAGLPRSGDLPTSSVSAPVEQMSAKAAGKQRAREETVKDGQASAGPRKATIDTQSHDLFPQLGAGPQSRAPPPVAAAWGTKKSSASPIGQNGIPSGASTLTAANGHHVASSVTSSRASTPTSGIATPNSNNASNIPTRHAQSLRGPMPQQMTIPGRYSERITLFPQEMKDRTQLRKPVQDILREINKKSKANVQMLAGADRAYHFEAKGPVEAVRQALKDVAREIGSKQSIKVTVPASVRPHIIGKQGSIVQGISQRTGAWIQIPRTEEGASTLLDDDDAVIEISIEGDSLAAAMARREVENIVNERTTSVNMRLRNIPAEFYPFIAGPHNARASALEDGRDVRIRVPHNHIWTGQQPPELHSADEPLNFAPSVGDLIQLSGDRVAAQEVRAEIERIVQELQTQMTMETLNIDRGRHQFVIGERSASLHDFLAETGCTVLLPPPSFDTETLTIIGPRDQIQTGVDKVIDLAMNMQRTDVDISRQHLKAPIGPSAYARSLTRYLQRRREIERLERLYNAHINIPSAEDGSKPWEIYSRDGKDGFRARTEIINIVNGHPPSRLAHVDVDPFYHSHIQKQRAKALRDSHGVHMILPDEDEDPQILLVYEGPSGLSPEFELPKKQPSAVEVKEFERALQAAIAELESALGGRKEIVSKSVVVPKKFQDRVHKFVQRKSKGLSQDEIPVSVQFGVNRKSKLPTRLPEPSSSPEDDEQVLLRGPLESVESLAKEIDEFVITEREYDRERDFTLSFEFPQKFANYLIGKKGENIRKYQEEFDVDVRFDEGKVEIKGPKVKAEQAKSRIVALGKKLEDEVTYVLKVKPQYHRELIGAKGSQVNRLQDRYSVRVQFPRSAPSGPPGGDQAASETASDVGAGNKFHRPNQAPDEVVVRGPRKGAGEARDELLSLLQYTIDNSFTSTVSVARNQLPSLIGQGGREMEQLRMATGAQIDVPDNRRESGDASPRAEIRLKGTKAQVEEAKKLLEQRAKIYDESVTRKVDVDKKHHKALIGGGGATIRDIVIKAGGPDDRRELARMVRFPPQDSDENAIRVEGHKAIVDKIVALIEEIVRQRETEVTETVDMAPEKYRLLIGRGGETRRNLESQFGVNINIPKFGAGTPHGGVTVTGQPAEVEKAKSHILTMVKEQEGETVQVPSNVHHAVSDNGQFFRRLRHDHKVTVDHGNARLPPRNNPEPQRPNGSAMPLITDEQDPNAFAWEIRDSGTSSAGEGAPIPWILRGPPDNLPKARSLIEAAIEQAQRQSTVGYLVLPDPRSYRFVIGPAGSQVNAIRRETGCHVNVPRQGDSKGGEAIEIRGEREMVERAKDIILEVVQNGGNGGERRG